MGRVVRLRGRASAGRSLFLLEHGVPFDGGEVAQEADEDGIAPDAVPPEDSADEGEEDDGAEEAFEEGFELGCHGNDGDENVSHRLH